MSVNKKQLKFNNIGMKTITLLILWTAAVVAFAQSPIPIEISYDDAGNRIVRKVLDMSKSAKVLGQGDSTYFTDQLQRVQMMVYPNPTQGRVYVELTGTSEIKKSMLRVFDSKGQKIYENSGSGSSLEVDFSKYPAGYYIVELTVNEERTTWKVVKR